MPELPEIETICRDLAEALQGHSVVLLEVYDRRLLSEQQEKFFKQVLPSQKWDLVGRKGKYLTVQLSGGYDLILHLRMTGQLVLTTESGSRQTGIMEKRLGPRPRLVLVFDHGAQLAFYDQRRFGEVFLVKQGGRWPGKTKLGPDPLNGFTTTSFVGLVKGRSTRIKPLLMDQRLLAGIGNIYAQEALFKAAIRPSRPGRSVTRVEAERLYHALRETLLSAIEHRGSTSRNYRDAFGKQGTAQTLHAVYLRGGQPCLKCQGVLRATRVGGRGTVYCPHCQR